MWILPPSMRGDSSCIFQTAVRQNQPDVSVCRSMVKILLKVPENTIVTPEWRVHWLKSYSDSWVKSSKCESNMIRQYPNLIIISHIILNLLVHNPICLISFTDFSSDHKQWTIGNNHPWTTHQHFRCITKTSEFNTLLQIRILTLRYTSFYRMDFDKNLNIAYQDTKDSLFRRTTSWT